MKPFRYRQQLAVILAALIVVLVVACTPPAPAPPLTPVTTHYTTFGGDDLTLDAYVGKKVALLVPQQGAWRASVVTAIVAKLDAAYAYYQSITGREPDPFRQFRGRDSIAVVPSTCGAGCGYLGSTGIELQTNTWQILYDGAAGSGVYDQPLFYELGRNFWFLSPQLAYQPPDDGGSVVTGFAVLNRFTSMDAAHAPGGPFGSIPFAQFHADVHGLVDAYEANPSLTWANTLKVGLGVPGSYLGATDLFASVVMRLADYFGATTIYEHIWREAAVLPAATSSQAALDNFVLAASAAVGRNLTGLFTTTWRFPVSNAARATAQARWGNPWVRP